MTDLDLRAGQIHRGLGIVARWTDIALVIPSDSAHDTLVDDMFHQLGPEPDPNHLVGAVNELISAEKLQSIGMLVEATGGPMAMAFGPIEILVDGESVMHGGEGPVRNQLSNAATRLTIRTTNLTKAAEPVAPYDLRRGIAPGAGLTLVTIASVQPPPAPVGLASAVPLPSPEAANEPAVSPLDPSVATDQNSPRVSPSDVGSGRVDDQAVVPDPTSEPQSSPVGEPGNPPPERHVKPAVAPSSIAVPFRSVVLIGRPQQATVPLPIASSPKTGELSRGELDAGRVEVDGILCSREHFNNPGAAYCMVCGISMLHLTHNLVRGPRPTLGFIVFDDGSTFGLDRSYVVGREPSPLADSPAERLVLHDNNETLSRTHAELRLADWNVQLVDMKSTNGTYVWDRAFERWNQLAAGQPIELASGETVALGRRTFVFESVSRT